MLYLESGSCTPAFDPELDFLGDEEIRYLGSVGSLKRRTQFLAGRTLVRRMLCRVAGGRMSDWSLTAQPGVKPVVQGFPEIHVSISHSAGRVVCGLSDRPVGIDVETVKAGRDVRALGEQVFHPVELARMDGWAVGERDWRFTELWTIKEAWVKRTGSGLDFPRMRRLCAEPCAPGDEAQAVTLRYSDGEAGLAIAIVSSRLDDLNIEGDGSSPARWRLAEGH